MKKAGKLPAFFRPIFRFLLQIPDISPLKRNICNIVTFILTYMHTVMVEGEGWKVEGEGWKVEGEGWKVKGERWRKISF